MLLRLGGEEGDRVAIYLPMVPELAYSMLACARIGAIHSVVFAGFSAESLRDRILDARCKLLLTADEGLRGGKRIPLKETSDAAIEGLDFVEHMLVVRRTGKEVAMRSGRDLWLADEVARERPYAPTEWMSAEDPLYVLYTSGSTGKPKGVLHTTPAISCTPSLTHKYVFDVHDDDVYACVADVRLVTGTATSSTGRVQRRDGGDVRVDAPLPDAGPTGSSSTTSACDLLTAPTAIRASRAPATSR